MINNDYFCGNFAIDRFLQGFMIQFISLLIVLNILFV